MSLPWRRVHHRFDPWALTGNAAIYSLWGSPADETFLFDGSNRLQLVADRSGNSAVNCLVLNGVAGNYASAPDSAALSITGDIDIRVRVGLTDWTPSALTSLLAKRTDSGNQASYHLRVSTSGNLQLLWSPDGTSAALITATSSVAVSVADFAIVWVRATLDVDNGAGGYTVAFYTSLDGASWSTLGTTVVGGSPTSIANTTSVVEVGSVDTGTAQVANGRFHRAQIRSGIDGTVVFDADFTRVAKLASSFTESSANGATVTINTSGDTGARICGARDLVQLTQAKQPIVSIAADGRRIATFDGSDDYMKTAPFSFSQPESVYFVGSQVSWTLGEAILDGNSSTERLKVGQGFAGSSSPDLSLYAGADACKNSGWSVSIRGVLRAVYNGAASSLGVNLKSAVTGNAGALAANGFALAASQSGGTFANITFCEALLASRADNDALQLKIAGALMRKWGVS